MPDAYATVIVPTHDRASTVAAAISSIRAQTVPNIEIVIAGDGVTAEVRAVAHALVHADTRIVFHDFPKAPKRGGENRDRAVQMARSERIFYSDDDDLLLPRHVETLGPVLDQYDAADSPPAFVSRSGNLQVGLVNHARGIMRQALAAGTAKTVFDTHFAHRKSAYLRLDHPWAVKGDAIARDFFRRFAAEPSIRWKTVPTVTALSFNGRCRQSVSPQARLSEIEGWRRRLGSQTLLRDAFYDWHLFAFASKFPTSESTLEGLAAAAFVGIDGIDGDQAGDISYSIPEARLADLKDLFALRRGEPVLNGCAGDLVARLADPLIGWARPNSGGSAGAMLKRASGRDGMLKALRNIDDADSYASEMRAFLECWLFLSERQPAEALRRMTRLIERGAIFQSEACVQAARAHRKMGDRENALEMARMAIRHDPTLKSGYALEVQILVEAGMFAAAREVLRDAQLALPEHVAAIITREFARAELAQSAKCL